MLKLAGFADEISPSLDEQIRVCKANNVMYFELRGVAGKNVLDFDAPLRTEVKTKLAANGMGVASIGSPIGKVKINDSWPAHFDRFKIAVELAEFFNAPLIRIFSYYPPEKGQDIRRWRDEVMKRMQAKVDYIKGRPVTLIHENERDIYGEKGPECLDMLKTLNHPQFRNCFDFANFVQAGQKPLECWPYLKPYTVHIHVKDVRQSDMKIVPAGQGSGDVEPILVDLYKSGYQGFLSLEPHLKVAAHSHGETGPDLFVMAINALKDICKRNSIPLEGVK